MEQVPSSLSGGLYIVQHSRGVYYTASSPGLALACNGRRIGRTNLQPADGVVALSSLEGPWAGSGLDDDQRRRRSSDSILHSIAILIVA